MLKHISKVPSLAFVSGLDGTKLQIRAFLRAKILLGMTKKFLTKSRPYQLSKRPTQHGKSSTTEKLKTLEATFGLSLQKKTLNQNCLSLM